MKQALFIYFLYYYRLYFILDYNALRIIYYNNNTLCRPIKRRKYVIKILNNRRSIIKTFAENL